MFIHPSEDFSGVTSGGSYVQNMMPRFMTKLVTLQNILSSGCSINSTWCHPLLLVHLFGIGVDLVRFSWAVYRRSCFIMGHLSSTPSLISLALVGMQHPILHAI